MGDGAPTNDHQPPRAGGPTFSVVLTGEPLKSSVTVGSMQAPPPASSVWISARSEDRSALRTPDLVVVQPVTSTMVWMGKAEPSPPRSSVFPNVDTVRLNGPQQSHVVHAAPGRQHAPKIAASMSATALACRGACVTLDGQDIEVGEAGSKLTARISKRLRLLLAWCVSSHHDRRLPGLIVRYPRLNVDRCELAAALKAASRGKVRVIGVGDGARLSTPVHLDGALIDLAKECFWRAVDASTIEAARLPR